MRERDGNNGSEINIVRLCIYTRHTQRKRGRQRERERVRKTRTTAIATITKEIVCVIESKSMKDIKSGTSTLNSNFSNSNFVNNDQSTTNNDDETISTSMTTKIYPLTWQ